MKNPLLLLAFFSFAFHFQAYSQETFRVKGRFLYDPNGEKVILRGVNEMFIWSRADLTGATTFPEIAKTGANVVRIAWLSAAENHRGSAANLDAVITNCVKNGMIPMPELHGATGDWGKLQEQVDYWVSPEVVQVLKKHEAYLLLNIANEVGDRKVTDKQFRQGYEQAVARIRKAGIRCPLVIDGANWGQSIDILQANGPYLIQKDPLRNLLFSVHMWWTAPDGATKRIVSEINESVEQGLPLIVGEFAPMGVGCAESIDYKTIMAQCQQNQIGWMAWSWGLVDNGDCKLMDMTNDSLKGKFEGLSGWGKEVALTDKHSIKNTAQKTAYMQALGKEIK